MKTDKFPTSSHTFKVMGNNAAVKESCPICKTTFRPECGLWVFMNGNYSEPICEQCIEAHTDLAADVFI
jgi:hypothetical protein